jgi:hypothetical protein
MGNTQHSVPVMNQSLSQTFRAVFPKVWYAHHHQHAQESEGVAAENKLSKIVPEFYLLPDNSNIKKAGPSR